MSKELVVSSNRHETKVAILEDDQLVEIYFQHANEYSLAGSIHKGRVTRVLPGMQSAFVDLGLERDTFLYVSDFFEENGEEYDRITDDKGSKPQSRPERGEPRGDRRSDTRNEQSREREPREQAAAPAPATANAESEPLAIVEESAPAPAAVNGERPDRGENGRGRRGRRRRTRGGGFPESKYAAIGSSAQATDNPVVPQSETDAPAEEEHEIILLPGESLAKYQRPANDLSAAVSHEHPEDTPPVGEPTPDLPPATDPEPDSEPPRTEPEPYTEPAPNPDELPAGVASAFPEAGFIAPEILFAAPIEEPYLREQLLADLDEEEGSRLAEVAEPDADDHLPEDTAAPEGSGDPDEDLSLKEEEEVTSEAEAPDELEQEPASPDKPLTASIRDQGGRMPHRGTRRMRRRRGGEAPPPRAVVEAGVETPSAPPAPAPESRSASRTVTGEKSPLPLITDLLHEGQEIIVQIAKEPLGQKGARITSHIALPGRYVVYMPTLEHLGVSRKIASDEERLRLKRILQASRAGMSGGFIVRTAGEGHTEEEIAADMAYLYNLWLDIRSKAEKKPAPQLLHHDLDIVQRILRDQLNDMFKAIWCDNEESYESVLRFMQRFNPALVGRVKMYTRPAPILDAFNVSQEVEKALRPKVWLKSGGYIVINQTEALVAIDVNTGKYVGKSNRLEDTITKTNTEAVKEIVRQVRLRDLGGIIVVDFIDMDERKNRQKVMQALEEAMRADRAPYKILQFNDFGLVAITRKRVKQSLERSLCVPCPICDGAAYVKSVQTVVSEMMQEAMKIRPLVEGKNAILRAYPEVARFLKSNKNTYLEEIEEILGRPVMVTSDPTLHPEKFDFAW